jgi:beta-lactam-binding protein with PASTA domain
MSVIKFFTSKSFFIQVAIALGLIVVLCFLLLTFLDFRTNHGEEIKVPDLSKTQIAIAEEKLAELDLQLILLDTVEFDVKMPPFAIVEQDPKAGTAVKSGRKIYVKINDGTFSNVQIPEFKDKTYRQLSANIKSLGLVEGTIRYEPNIAKDVVLKILYNNKPLKEGDKLRKNSTVDFVLGDGKKIFDGSYLEDSESPDIPSMPETQLEDDGL